MEVNRNDFGYTNINGEAWKRFSRDFIDNPLKQSPIIKSVIDVVLNAGGKQMVVDSTTPSFVFNPEFLFTPRDMVTNLPKGSSMTMLELYEAISGCLQTLSVEEVNNG